MPHVPPRSPRRERKDDHYTSPHASDNEDEYPQSQHGSKKNGASATLLTLPRARGDHGQEQTSQSGQHQDGRDMHSAPAPGSPAATKVAFLGLPAAASRKPNPGQGLAHLAPNMPNPLEGPSSPTTTPTSPINAIIDQDAEKFRIYMNKNGTPHRKVAPVHNDPAPEGGDHATALGQAVAMENIQAQIEIQNQFTNPPPSKFHLDRKERSCLIEYIAEPQKLTIVSCFLLSFFVWT